MYYRHACPASEIQELQGSSFKTARRISVHHRLSGKEECGNTSLPQSTAAREEAWVSIDGSEEQTSQADNSPPQLSRGWSLPSEYGCWGEVCKGVTGLNFLRGGSLNSALREGWVPPPSQFCNKCRQAPVVLVIHLFIGHLTSFHQYLLSAY